MNEIKQIDGKYYQNCKVFIIETKDTTPLFLNTHQTKIGDMVLKHGKFHHLYFTSDEEIKEPCWVYNLNGVGIENQIFFVDSDNAIYNCRQYNWKKIIATTDKLSTEPYQGHFEGIDCTNYLPQPSQQFIEKFIEKYNKGNQITEVLVEVINLDNIYITQEDLDSLNCTDFSKVASKYNFKYIDDFFNAINDTLFLIDGYKVYDIKIVQLHDIYQDYFKGEFLFEIIEFEKKYQLKLDSQNQITTSKPKDSWSRKEVEDLCRKAYLIGRGSGRSLLHFDVWIEENL